MSEKKQKELPSVSTVLPSDEPIPASIEDKRKMMKGLATMIAVLAKPLSMKDDEMAAAIQFGLKDRLQKLDQEFQLREADIKIIQMRKMIDLLKHVKAF